MYLVRSDIVWFNNDLAIAGNQNHTVMRLKLLIRYLLIFVVAIVLLASCHHRVPNNSAAINQPSSRILLIGNSYTYFNNGIDKHLRGLAPGSQVTRVAIGGYTLEQHWNNSTTRQTLGQGGWNSVVLQEQSQTPIFDAAKFRRFAGEFDRQIKAIGGKTVLLMTWERPDSVALGVTTQTLANAYTAIGTELGAKVAPAGLAFARALSEKPDLFLNSFDGHPSIYGTYLAACVLYGTIFERSPVGNSYTDEGISTELQTYLQTIAAKTLGYQ